MTRFIGGDKVKIAPGSGSHSAECELVGIVKIAEEYETLVRFTVSHAQYSYLDWGGKPSGDFYIIDRWLHNTCLQKAPKAPKASGKRPPEHQALLDKKDRSPVEDYLLFSLEEDYDV
jgi:hypothetical protein